MESSIYNQLEKISPSLRAFSLKLTGSEADANDLYQDTSYRIISNADKYTPDTNFKAWAVTIMRIIFINNYRKKVRRGVILDQTPNNYYLNSGGPGIENDGEMMMGYKYDEIAEKLDAPLGTIKSRIFFARRKLQKMYEDASSAQAA
jgi:RNA polymerase sigma-70 factor (ECF subfamily)